MEKNQDIYKTIKTATTGVLFKDRNSKFLGYAYPVQQETDIKQLLDTLRTEHSGANHVCYAWQLGVGETSYRVNDDGEPSHSAGTPIYGQIQAFELTNILVAVVRYFGGTKLGVGGLVSAYRTTAQMTLTESKVVRKKLMATLFLEFEYVSMNKVMRIVKKHSLRVVSQTMDMKCKICLSLPKSDFQKIKGKFEAIQEVLVKE
ncbi:IMPACT family protein [Muriicola sp.]|uniref:IMPACT family protein n=1 Tax=Muriicola sp. TaxID=2020856 RepID=UPI003C791278